MAKAVAGRRPNFLMLFVVEGTAEKVALAELEVALAELEVALAELEVALAVEIAGTIGVAAASPAVALAGRAAGAVPVVPVASPMSLRESFAASWWGLAPVDLA